MERNLIDHHALYDWTNWADAEVQAKRHVAEMCEILDPGRRSHFRSSRTYPMAERPIFVPNPASDDLVKEIFLQLVWSPGFALVQKEKNIDALHKAAEAAGYKNILEVSTKSEHKRGQHLSAFHLKVKTKALGEVPLESAFQGSKVFEKGGPFVDLCEMEPKDAKKDLRLRESGKLIGFDFEGNEWPPEPKTAFYDWLYAGSLYPHRDWIRKLSFHDGFSDIEFNPFR